MQLRQGAAVSQDARDIAHQALGGEYEVVFNGIEIDKFVSATAYETDRPTIAYVGRHEPRKGLETLLEALSQMPSDLTLWVMSEGPQTPELQKKYEAESRIEWLGAISEEEKVGRIKGADVLCVPSLHGESLSLIHI